MERDEEDREGDPRVALNVAGVEGALVRRLVNAGVEIEKFVRKYRLTIELESR